MNNMQAVRIHRFGGLQELQWDEVGIPRPATGEVRVRVEAASLNPVDYKTRSGKYPLVREDQLPYTLGRDFAGVIVEDGAADGTCAGDTYKTGAAVFGFMGQQQGAFAEFIVIERNHIARMPEGLDFVAAAAVPLAGLTAWQGLFDHGGLQAGQRVLIHAAAGGVGHFAVQFAKARGAQVYATAASDSLEFVKSLGADVVIDYKKQSFDSIARDIDVVFDLIGGDTQKRSWSVLKNGGALISTVAEPARELAEAHHIRTARYTARPDGAQLAEIARLIGLGQVRVHVARTFPFADVIEAERQLEAGHIRGKLVLEMGHA